MRMPISVDWRVVLAASALALSPSAVPAQTPGEVAGWNKICYQDAATAGQACTVLYQIVAENGQFIAQASLNQVQGEARIVLQIWIVSSPGIIITPGLRVQVDDAPPTAVPYALCNSNVCIGETEVPTAFIDSLKRGGQLLVSAMIPAAAPDEDGRRQIDFPVTLVGFTAAYDGPGMNEAEAQARQEELNRTLQDRAEAARQRLIQQQQQQQLTPPPATP